MIFAAAKLRAEGGAIAENHRRTEYLEPIRRSWYPPMNNGSNSKLPEPHSTHDFF
jgi:hypothetical protein